MEDLCFVSHSYPGVHASFPKDVPEMLFFVAPTPQLDLQSTQTNGLYPEDRAITLGTFFSRQMLTATWPSTLGLGYPGSTFLMKELLWAHA